jgi:hypothetical protein
MTTQPGCLSSRRRVLHVLRALRLLRVLRPARPARRARPAPRLRPDGPRSRGSQYSSFWVGLDGYSSSSVEQTGSDTDCSGGRAVYYAWYEMYPNPSVSYSNTVRPGDQFNASVTYAGSNQAWAEPKKCAEATVVALPPFCTQSALVLATAAEDQS